ncbi:MAG: PH domain-containing protein [Hyphomicrobiales bacterium]|nr:PH domain-containing protein [Hyphomicrobiales bacterium]
MSKPPAASKPSPVRTDKGDILDNGEDITRGGADELPADLDFPAGQSSILSKTIELQPMHIYKAHWQIFAPTFVICFLYLAGWVILFILGKSGDSLARLFIVVLAVGVPILFAYAFLRYQTISIEIFDKYLRYHSGWPKADPVVIPYALIKNADFSKNLTGRLFGGGTVTLQLDPEKFISIADVEKTSEARKNITAMIK